MKYPRRKFYQNATAGDKQKRMAIHSAFYLKHVHTKSRGQQVRVSVEFLKHFPEWKHQNCPVLQPLLPISRGNHRTQLNNSGIMRVNGTLLYLKILFYRANNLLIIHNLKKIKDSLKLLFHTVGLKLFALAGITAPSCGSWNKGGIPVECFIFFLKKGISLIKRAVFYQQHCEMMLLRLHICISKIRGSSIME